MQNAELYEEANCLQRRDAQMFLEKYATKISKRKFIRVFDIGCGDGSVTSMLMKYLPPDYKLLGIDISENMVQFAKEQHSNEQTTFTVMDFKSDLPSDMQGSFDLVFSSYVLHWFKNQEHAFRNIFSLLDKGGECVLLFVGCNSLHSAYRQLARIERWSKYLKNAEDYVSPYQDSKEPEKEIRKIMEDIGFVEIEVECKDTEYSYAEFDTMTKHLSAISPFKIPREENDDFLQDYVRILSESDSTESMFSCSIKDLKFNYKLISVYGRKP